MCIYEFLSTTIKTTRQSYYLWLNSPIIIQKTLVLAIFLSSLTTVSIPGTAKKKLLTVNLS